MAIPKKPIGPQNAVTVLSKHAETVQFHPISVSEMPSMNFQEHSVQTCFNQVSHNLSGFDEAYSYRENEMDNSPTIVFDRGKIPSPLLMMTFCTNIGASNTNQHKTHLTLLSLVMTKQVRISRDSKNELIIRRLVFDRGRTGVHPLQFEDLKNCECRSSDVTALSKLLRSKSNIRNNRIFPRLRIVLSNRSFRTTKSYG